MAVALYTPSCAGSSYSSRILSSGGTSRGQVAGGAAPPATTALPPSVRPCTVRQCVCVPHDDTTTPPFLRRWASLPCLCGFAVRSRSLKNAALPLGLPPGVGPPVHLAGRASRPRGPTTPQQRWRQQCVVLVCCGGAGGGTDGASLSLSSLPPPLCRPSTVLQEFTRNNRDQGTLLDLSSLPLTVPVAKEGVWLLAV